MGWINLCQTNQNYERTLFSFCYFFILHTFFTVYIIVLNTYFVSSGIRFLKQLSFLFIHDAFSFLHRQYLNFWLNRTFQTNMAAAVTVIKVMASINSQYTNVSINSTKLISKDYFYLLFLIDLYFMLFMFIVEVDMICLRNPAKDNAQRTHQLWTWLLFFFFTGFTVGCEPT